ncbi:uncharacterized protein FOBCDRAFT_204769 [Fusarium oxysporum Fo47]|uniref:uncharacterized protein n=1 Tax=Fusarium oxysporum Fo47 TaxID=660027 RepID=UPI0028699C3A|nr:uncharacterized protein FOBCDRAFT_204769 [Fusarium oxysporum Fo47]WJG35942.1 hypothetical protein FOBCDRAFT_204769 [Fusarium oxysporum Fo47]
MSSSCLLLPPVISMPLSSPMFIDGLASSQVIQTVISRHLYRKSRTGCQRCRAQRVKCVHDCIVSGSESIREAPVDFLSDDCDIDEPEESAERRNSELELLHFCITETGPFIPFD